MIRNILSSHSKEIIEEVKPYLEFKSTTPMTITPNYTNTGITLQYSLDTVNWVNIAAKAVTPSANVIYFRGRATGTKSLFTVAAMTSNRWEFTGATNLEAIGSLNSLIQDNLGDNVIDIPLGDICYNNMFYSCSALIKAPDLPSTILGKSCYQSMFNRCVNLTTPVILPARVLTFDCYAAMYRDCSNLIKLPKLLATVMESGCYRGMFYRCTKIKLSTTKTGNYQTEYRVPTVGTGVTTANALTDMFTSTGGTFKGTPTINTTYYTENTVV